MKKKFFLETKVNDKKLVRNTKKQKEKKESLFPNRESIEKATVAMRLFNNKFRQMVLVGLNEIGESSVTEIHTHLNMSQVICSIHLQGLRKLGLVKIRRENKNVYYSIDKSNLELLLNRIDALASQLELGVSSR